MAIATDQQ